MAETAKGRREDSFTRVWSWMLAPLTEAKLNGTEWAVLVSLLRYQNGSGIVWRKSEDIAEECGLSPSAVRRALASMTNRKTFTNADGETVPVLTRVSTGHRGHVSEYRCNAMAPLCATDSLRFQAGKAQQNEGDSATVRSSKRNNGCCTNRATNRTNQKNKELGVYEAIGSALVG